MELGYKGVVNLLEDRDKRIKKLSEQLKTCLERTAGLEAEKSNTEDLLIHYGYDHGSIPERVDTLCAAIIDNADDVGRLLKRIEELEEAVKGAQYIEGCALADVESANRRVAELERAIRNAPCPILGVTVDGADWLLEYPENTLCDDCNCWRRVVLKEEK